MFFAKVSVTMRVTCIKNAWDFKKGFNFDVTTTLSEYVGRKNDRFGHENEFQVVKNGPTEIESALKFKLIVF